MYKFKMRLIYFSGFLSFISAVSASSLAAPPKSALLVAFEDEYDLSLLANTLSNEGIDSTLIVSRNANDLYQGLIDVEVIKLDIEDDAADSKEKRALRSCKVLLEDENLARRVKELQPTFLIFPGIRHDACLLPWAKRLDSIPVIYARGTEAETYAFSQSGVALPIHSGGIWTRLSSLLSLRSTLVDTKSSYVVPALKIIQEHLPEFEGIDLESLYADVDLVFWGADPILRSGFSAVSETLVEIGCHHCRGAQPLSPDLQKELIDYRLGTIAVLLDEDRKELIQEVALGLPQGRQGQAVVWISKNVHFENDKPENLFVHDDMDRQDLIGFPRTRVLLSHCEDTVLLEAGFHGTPVICFPRNQQEFRNALRAVELGISYAVDGDFTPATTLTTIKHIHETAKFRESARKISVAIRDRPNPPMDRITYWLGYIARHKNVEKFLAGRNNRNVAYQQVYNIDLWLTVGFLMGAVTGALLPFAYLLATRILAANKNLGSQAHKSKKKYKM